MPATYQFSGIILAKLVTYYSYNYASIIGAGLVRLPNWAASFFTARMAVFDFF